MKVCYLEQFGGDYRNCMRTAGSRYPRIIIPPFLKRRDLS